MNRYCRELTQIALGTIYAIVLFVAVAAVSGCTGTREPVIEGTNLIRCSEYSGNTAVPLGSGRVDGCQCIQAGEFQGTVTIALATCEITLEP